MKLQRILHSPRALHGNVRGATAVEFALIIPVWILIVFLFLNIGRFYMARAGVLNGLGTAAREATLWPLRSNEQLISSFNAGTFGLLPGEVAAISILPGTMENQNYVDITVTFTPQMLLAIVPLQPITLTYNRRVYQPA